MTDRVVLYTKIRKSDPPPSKNETLSRELHQRYCDILPTAPSVIWGCMRDTAMSVLERARFFLVKFSFIAYSVSPRLGNRVGRDGALVHEDRAQ